MGRTVTRWERVYVDGCDLSGMGRTIGPLKWESEEVDLTAEMADAVKGSLPGMPSVGVGTYNGVMQSTTDSGTEVSKIVTAGVTRDIMVVIGNNAAPAIGDPVYVCKSSHNGFHVVEDGGAITITADFGESDANDLPPYGVVWGKLLYPKGDLATANSSTTDSVDNTVASTGGFMAYQVFGDPAFRGDMVTNIKVQSCDTNVNGDFADVAGLTANVDGATSSAGIVATTLSTTPIGRYARWQIGTILSGTNLHIALALFRRN